MSAVFDTRLAALRAVLARGRVGAAEAARALGVSQPTFSRLVKEGGDDVVVTGRGRSTLYFAARGILGSGKSVPVTEVEPDGSTRPLGFLRGVLPRAFLFDGQRPHGDAHFEDLPYFLHDLRPAGFLGRLIPRQHPELHFPTDISLWTADNVVAYASQLGWDLPGNLILGTPAFQTYLLRTQQPPHFVADDERELVYPRRAQDVLSAVKFSPASTDPVAERIADLLVAEHVALQTMRAHGQDAARTELVVAGGRTFLESERFDRLPAFGRRGVISLFALDAHFLGQLSSWIASSEALVAAKVLPATVTGAVRWRQRFGELIGNTDMHGGNLSFFTQALKPVALAPAYDMTPARYAPRQGEVLALPPLHPPLPEPYDVPIWAEVCEAAENFWNGVAQHPLVSAGFRTLAKENAALVADRGRLAKRLHVS